MLVLFELSILAATVLERRKCGRPPLRPVDLPQPRSLDAGSASRTAGA